MATIRRKRGLAGSSPRVTGESLFSLNVTYQGSKTVGTPYGEATVESVARKLLDPSGDADRKQLATGLVVTYDGVFVRVSREAETALFACGPREVGLVWCDRQDDTFFALVSHVEDPVVMVACHVFRVEQGVSCKEVLPSLVENLNIASIGRYPGALGVFKAEYGGSVSVDSPNGADTVNEAMKRIKELAIPERQVEIVIYETRLSVIDRDAANELKVFSIPEVSFTSIDPKHPQKLSIITRDAQFGLLYCHAFRTDGAAEPIPRTIGVAFQKVTALMQTGDRERLKELGLLVAAKGTSGAIGVFDVKHIATVPTKGNKGNETVQAALDVAIREGKTREPFLLVVSEDGIRAIDGLTSEVNSSTVMQHVNFVTTIGEKKNIFAFMSVDSRLKRKLVHMYECSAAMAVKISKAVGEGFKMCAEKLKEAKENKNQNPFRPVDKKREAAPGSLFKCQLHRADIQPDKVIGAGQFGQVYLAQFQKSTRVAVKTVRLAASDDDKEDFVHEAEVMLDLVHPGLVKLLGVAVQQRPWLCVIEFMKYGDLRDVLQTCKERNFTISFWEQLKIVMQICGGLQFMASKRYIHMDVAARNCLIDEGNVVKLADFGLTRKLDEGTNRYLLKKTAKLPVRWVALEALETGVFSQASDVWAFGVLVWEVLSYGELPYEAVPNIDVQKRVKAGLRLVKPPDANPDLFDIAESCWKLPKKMRPLFNPLMERLKALEDEAKESSVPERDLGKACQEDH
eukprot:m.28978 g.28978  ORF g.28978 m.28978 type:complete len:741 (-) comp4563_c1_seq1:31-2253(-)